MVRACFEQLSPFFIGCLCFFFSWICYPLWIKWIKNFNLLTKGHVDHILDQNLKLFKEKTPSFGGVLFLLIPFLIVPIIFNPIPKAYYAFLVLALLMALVGLFDDLLKLVPPKKGISSKAKSLGQLFASAVFLGLVFFSEKTFILHIPFGQDLVFESFIFKSLFLFFLAFILVGTSNAVNLTDGMDGLAGLLSLVTLFFLAAISYFEGEVFLTWMIVAFMGSLLGFFLFNKKPAKIFMGDVGSLPLGALIAGFAIFLHQELLLVFLGGMFVIETLSVILQVSYYKKTKKRIFLCAPLHHHFQFYGHKEDVIVHRFAACQSLFALVGFCLYWTARNYV